MSKNTILAGLRSHSIDPVPHPGTPKSGLTFDNPLSAFATTLESIGGQFVEAGERNPADFIKAHYEAATIVASAVEGIPSIGIDLNAIQDPHELEHVDVAIIRGGVAVAENAAIWVTAKDSVHRVLPFITQHLVLIIRTADIVSNMHQAYARPEVRPSNEGFGAWIAGPSKTADIEQSLVIGAHGARSLLVIGT